VHLPSLALSLALLSSLPLTAGGQTPASTEPVPIVISAGASDDLAKALDEALARFTLEPDADEADEELALRRAERAAREVLATEGYFEPVLRFEPNPARTPRYRLLVEVGPLTRVARVDLEFTGAISQPQFAARAEALRQSWPLSVGSPFRSAQWEEAKSRLLAAVQARDFAAAQIVASSAEVDVEKAAANLKFQIDSGPAFRLGPLKIEGLNRFEPALVERFSPFKPGDPYDRARLTEFQQALQNSAYFSSAVATVDLNPATADNAPLLVELREAPIRRFATAVGYGTNNGAHLEVLYRQSITFDRPYPLQTGFRIDQNGGFAYADLFFPPQRSGARDSVGVLYEDSDIQDLQVRRWGAGAVRSQLQGPRDGKNIETQWSINFEHELRKTPLDPQIELNTLSTTYSWIRRNVDDVTNPRNGNLLRLEGSVGASGVSTDDLFVRGYGRLVQYLPLGERDVLILRGELGGVAAESTNSVSNTFLFRTGGSTTVRGYNFDSLGVEQGGAIVGGRALVVGSVEVVHWLQRWDGRWGIAAFVDAGDAAETFKDIDVALGYGLGLRWRTPVGPLAIDVAYGERYSQVRVQFSVAIAF